MRSRLLYLVGDLDVGGYQRQLWYLLQSIDRERYRPAVVTWNSLTEEDYASRIRALGIPIHVVPTEYRRHEKLSALRRLVAQLSPEVIHSYSFYTNFAACWAAYGKNGPIAVGSVRSNFTADRKASGPWLGRLSARWPRDQICNSMAAARAAGDLSLFAPKRLSVVRNGIDLKRFQHSPLPSHEPVRILGVGSLLSYKRWDRLVHVAHKLKTWGYRFDMHIVGDGPLLGVLQQLVGTLGLDKEIKMKGAAEPEAVSMLMQDSTFLVHTSDVEGCPNVIVEAMACGRAVVATDAGDVPDLVEEGKTGFVVTRGDEFSLAKRMATLIENRELCSSMGQEGRLKAEREFGMSRLVKQTLAAYQTAGWESA